MGTFVTDSTADGTDIFPDGDKSAAPGVSARPGWTTDNYLTAAEANAIRDAALDLRTAIRGLVFNVKHYGATGDGVTSDYTAISAAKTAIEAAGGGTLFFPEGTYYLGQYGADTLLFHFEDESNIRIIGDDALLKLETTGNFKPRFWTFTGCENIYVEGLRFQDTGFDVDEDWRGAVCFRLVAAGARGGLHGVTFRNITVDNCVDSIEVAGNVDQRIRGIWLQDWVVRNSYYGPNFAENGDAVRIRNLRCENVVRAYFAYGVVDHDVDVSIRHDGSFRGSSATCLIKRYIRDTKCIRIRAYFEGDASVYSNAVCLEHQPTSGNGVIDSVDVDLTIHPDMVSFASMTPVRFRSYTSGGVEETTTTANRWDRISLRGHWGQFGSAAIVIGAQQTTEGRLYIDPSVGKGPSSALPHYPGFVVRTAHDREYRTVKGDLTSASNRVVLPMSPFDGKGFTVKLTVHAHNNSSDVAAQKIGLRECYVTGYNAGGGAITLQQTDDVVSVFRTTDPGITIAASGENIEVYCTHADYSGANAFMRVTLEWISKGPAFV